MEEKVSKKCSISIVSHGQFDLVSDLLNDLEAFAKNIHEIILTINIPETFAVEPYTNNIVVIQNEIPCGFGANHNTAFSYCSADIFLVLNPDLRIIDFDFDLFLRELCSKDVGLVTPIVENANGSIEDHVRPYPTPLNLAQRVLGRLFSHKPEYPSQLKVKTPYWIAGMFMGFKSSMFREVGGFDTRYFMYMEDVDICAKILNAGYKIGIDSGNKIIHDARRGSQRNLRLFLIHFASYIKYFRKWAGK